MTRSSPPGAEPPIDPARADLDDLLDALDTPIVLVDADLAIRRTSAAARTLFPLATTDVGRTLADALPAFGDVDLVAALGGVVGDGATFEREVQVTRWYTLRATPRRAADGRIAGAVLTLADIDPLKRTQLALAETESRFVMLADNAPVLIWIMDLDEVRHANRAYREWIGVTEPMLSRDAWMSFIHPDDRDGYLALYRECCARRTAFQTQFRLRRHDGDYRWMKSSAIPRTTVTGELLGYAGCSFDIHDLKQAEQLLRDANDVKNRFLAVVAHELRTPLAAIANAVHVLSQPEPHADLHAAARAILARQAANMSRLVDDLVDSSRVVHGLVRLRHESVDLLDIVRHAAEATGPARAAQDIALSLDLPGSPLLVDGDPLRLEQIVSNLLGNAAKFSPRGGRIRVEIARERGTLDDPTGAVAVIRVSDDGAGIDPAMLDRVFEPFTQLDPHGAPARLGMGLGLALTRQLTELHGGRIRAISDGRGRGSRFTVRLPIPPERLTGPVLPAGGAMRVLVVDDDADAADSLRLALRLHAFETDVAYDGHNALALADQREPHIVLVDLTLPDMSGWDVARALRRDARFVRALIVAVTGLGGPEDRRRSHEAGIDRHLTKPLDFGMLQKLIGEWRQARGGAPASR
jgi:two-component system CheB/CheR fusion protein